MAIIDPEGLFGGDRLAACSDIAQLYWPRFFIAANSCARLELSYASIISKIFRNFKKTPKSSEIWAVFKEYEDNYLAILYQANGRWWCQFITSEKFLPKYKLTRDKLSPAPPLEMLEKHQNGYLDWKRLNSFDVTDFGNFQKVSKGEGRGGVGIGEGVGEEKAFGVYELPTLGGSYSVPQKLYDTYVKAYPGIDVMRELGKMEAWLASHATEQKTLKGMPAFMNRWLARAQNNGGSNGHGTTYGKQKEQGTVGGATGAMAKLADRSRRVSEASHSLPGGSNGSDVSRNGGIPDRSADRPAAPSDPQLGFGESFAGSGRQAGR